MKTQTDSFCDAYIFKFAKWIHQMEYDQNENFGDEFEAVMNCWCEFAFADLINQFITENSLPFDSDQIDAVEVMNWTMDEIAETELAYQSRI